MPAPVQGRARTVVAAVAVVVLAGGAVALAGGVREADVGDDAQATHRDGAGGVASSREAVPTAAAVTAGGATGAPAADEAAGGGVGGLGVAPGAPVAPGGPRVVRSATIEVEVAEGGFRAAFDRATRVATDLGGFVTGSATHRDGDATAGSVTLRVPEARFDDARRRLAGLGEVTSESVHGEDVGGQLVDLAARLRSLRAQEDVLRNLLGRATTVGEVIQVEEQLSRMRTQIEQLAAEEARLEDAVTLSTVTVSLSEPGASVPSPEPAGVLARSLERAVEGALAVVGGTIVVVGWLVPLSVLALLGVASARFALRGKVGGWWGGATRDSAGAARA